MSRQEEYEKVYKKMIESSQESASGTYEEMALLQQGIIATCLSEISKSLAVIADKLEGSSL